MIKFSLASSEEDYEVAKKLFRDYEESLDFKIDFLNFEEEMESLAEIYSLPQGALLIAKDDGNPVGCIAIKHHEGDIAELKRMYVVPSHRNKKIGLKLLVKALEVTRKLDYHKIRLESVRRLEEAGKLFDSFGFYEIHPYGKNPLEDAIFMEKVL